MRATVFSGFFLLGLVPVLAPVPAAAESLLERGAYLMRGIVACGNCHTVQTPEGPLPGRELAGGNPIPAPGLFTAHPPNITPDPETGIGKWSDDEIIAAIREGRRPDGTIIGPPMPIGLYRGISDRDARALVAYLRTVPAVRNAVPKSDYQIPLPPAYGPPVGSVAEVPRDDSVAYGAYLAGPAGHCIECHTPLVEGHPDFENRLAAGGFEFDMPFGVVVSPNITPHPSDGIGRYTDAQVKRIITNGIRPDGTRLLPPMGVYYYRNISGRDLDAIVAYFRSLPPLPDE